jgi:hypothetical protein
MGCALMVAGSYPEELATDPSRHGTGTGTGPRAGNKPGAPTATTADIEAGGESGRDEGRSIIVDTGPSLYTPIDNNNNDNNNNNNNTLEYSSFNNL